MSPLSASLRPGSVLALSLLLTACSAPATTDQDTAGERVDAGGAVSFGHIHDLGLNPAEGRVYVATHHGLYFLEGKMAHPAGEARYDTMGFTVVGPDTFLASGHPAPDDDAPANLGLLRSTDAGETWTEVSLGGQSDFHALTAVDDKIYGLDSTTGAVKHSADGGSTWREMAVIQARDIDADPSSPERVLATTADGLAISEDAGASFRPAESQPPKPLVVIDHLPGTTDTSSTVVGLDAAGVLWRTGGGGWVSAGPENGAPEAFTAVDEDTYLAAFNMVVYRTEDGGRSWESISAAQD
ncbi:F510_1955 family glycosylhydrolase [Georgenia sp. AZ-5]|uniref:F510_1955 family glycosylhydrolase n=1 Tax=Georgenia sp. AZ-5 TaxID=3367526 RepID=UPI003754827B